MGERELPATAFALLGLLVFDSENEAGLTGYELKQRADRTLRFYWVSPAMSQVYSELKRLASAGYVAELEAEGTTCYRVTDEGECVLTHWLFDCDPGFPVLKHPVALRLLMGRLSTTESLQQMLTQHLEDLAVRRAELQAVRELLGDDHDRRYAALVADWGLDYYDSETRIVGKLRGRLESME